MITPDGPRYPWAGLLRTVNRRIHERHERSVASAPPRSRHLVEAHRPPEWLGTTGVGEEELARHEERLGIRLPPSYREFLQISNGWDVESYSCLHLLPLAEVGWTRDVDPHLAETWGDPMGDTLYLSEYIDGQVCLLFPGVVAPDGEWQAWDFATWHPGVLEYRSFWDLMTRMCPEFASEAS
ncbi:SMI1/KNR4 family protein [Nonomuraea sp. KM90]|uniref:SMI1/KNR4 family protein n=1 Tax=Nonomuraea sp. KM90 TaxID=3457428 RepID=UPI003FCD802F